MYHKGDKVWWWSSLSPKTKAIFVEYDPDFPKRDCLLAIRIGTRDNHMTHIFRWPLRWVTHA